MAWERPPVPIMATFTVAFGEKAQALLDESENVIPAPANTEFLIKSLLLVMISNLIISMVELSFRCDKVLKYPGHSFNLTPEF